MKNALLLCFLVFVVTHTGVWAAAIPSERHYDTASELAHRLRESFLKLSGDYGKTSSTGSSELDLVFVVDNSGSIGRDDFNLEKKFVEDLIDHFSVSPTQTRVAVVTYSTNVKMEFDFNTYTNGKSLQEGIQSIKYTGGVTATGPALQYVRNSLIFNSAAGARNGANKAIFVLTDGHWNYGIDPAIPAGQLKNSGVIMFALGVSGNVRRSELLAMATSQEKHVFHVERYNTLGDVARILKSGPLGSQGSQGSQDSSGPRRALGPPGALGSFRQSSFQAKLRKLNVALAKVQPMSPLGTLPYYTSSTKH